jgi:hypothetical protein
MSTDSSTESQFMAASRLMTFSNVLAAAATILWLGGCGAGMLGVRVGFLVGVPGFVMLVIAGVIGQVGRSRQKRLHAARRAAG